MAVNKFFACPDDCADVLNLPILPTDEDCILLPDSSEIQYLWIRPTGAPSPFTGWDDASRTTITATANSIDNAVTDNSKSKVFKIIGSVAAPEKTTVVMPGFKTLTSRRTYTLNALIPSLADDKLYDFVTGFAQCGKTDGYTIYYGTERHVYGKSTGIQLASIDAELVKETGRESYEQANLIMTFEATTDPFRRNNPYA